MADWRMQVMRAGERQPTGRVYPRAVLEAGIKGQKGAIQVYGSWEDARSGSLATVIGVASVDIDGEGVVWANVRVWDQNLAQLRDMMEVRLSGEGVLDADRVVQPGWLLLSMVLQPKENGRDYLGTPMSERASTPAVPPLVCRGCGLRRADTPCTDCGHHAYPPDEVDGLCTAEVHGAGTVYRCRARAGHDAPSQVPATDAKRERDRMAHFAGLGHGFNWWGRG